jgi:uncharacterized protein (DUF1697 family)
MADFKQLLLDSGFQNVQTYIQSGNILCKGDQKKTVVKQQIERLIKENYGFEVTVLVLNSSELEHIIQNNPFVQSQVPIEKLYCTLLEKKPDLEAQRLLLEYNSEDEEFVFDGALLYFCYHIGYGKSKVNNPFVEKKLKIQGTTRNWKTMNKLLELSSS